MNKNNFTDDDKIKLINLLNLVAQHAEFKFNTQQVIEYYKLLNYAQTVLLPKIDEHVLEIKKVVQLKEEESKPKGKRSNK